MTCQLLGCYLVRSSKGGCRVLFAAHGGVLLQDVASNVSSPHAWSSFDSRRMAGECRQKAKTWMTCQLLGCYLVRTLTQPLRATTERTRSSRPSACSTLTQKQRVSTIQVQLLTTEGPVLIRTITCFHPGHQTCS
ncbi:calmodulin-like protein 4 isoform X4 [Balaenoptera musculus]|uniref:Calmodulin-like protein 4 isoform X4 n=1 Tax=Balaenoptera musculus TaxID=9771 RepID=A0A8B8WKQ6_BALMU|nr:calmodulin-like protein 4 isoform X4 [Balaenoptera musculus]